MIALTRAVSLRIAECELTHLARTPIAVHRARAGQAAYADDLRALSCRAQRVLAASGLRGSNETTGVDTSADVIVAQ